MIKYEIVEYTLPAYWASALINGDVSGMEDDEIIQLDKFVDDVVIEHGHACFTIADDDDEPSFTAYHDAKYLGVLAADCFTYTLLIEKEDRNRETD